LNRYLPTDFEKLKAGEYTYNTTDKAFSFLWKSGALEETGEAFLVGQSVENFGSSTGAPYTKAYF